MLATTICFRLANKAWCSGNYINMASFFCRSRRQAACDDRFGIWFDRKDKRPTKFERFVCWLGFLSCWCLPVCYDLETHLYRVQTSKEFYPICFGNAFSRVKSETFLLCNFYKLHKPAVMFFSFTKHDDVIAYADTASALFCNSIDSLLV